MKIKLSEIPIDGAWLLKAFFAQDERGSLSKYFEKEMRQKLRFAVDEILISRSNKNVVRGLHYQYPDAQNKIVWCIKGKAHEILLDMREDSPTFGKTYGVSLSEGEANGVFVPKGVAHGFASIEDGTQILYAIDGPQSPKNERGVRFDDEELNIDWHVKKEKIITSKKDKTLPAFKDALKTKMEQTQ